MNTGTKQGFVLIYTVIMVGIVLGIIILNYTISLSEIYASRNQEQSTKAFYAADSAIECVKYWNNKSQAFDNSKPAGIYSCGVGAPFDTSQVPRQPVCDARVYRFTIDGFSNGACADVRVTTVPLTSMVAGVPVTVCGLKVIAAGKNSCSATGRNLVERTRWEDF